MNERLRPLLTDIEEFEYLIQRVKDLILQEERIRRGLEKGWDNSDKADKNEKELLLRDIGDREFIDALKKIVLLASDIFPERYRQFEKDSYNYMQKMWDLFTAAATTDSYNRYIDDLTVRILHMKDHVAFMETAIDAFSDKSNYPETFGYRLGEEKYMPMFENFMDSRKKIESLASEQAQWKRQQLASNEEFLKLQRELSTMRKEFKKTYSHERGD